MNESLQVMYGKRMHVLISRNKKGIADHEKYRSLLFR